MTPDASTDTSIHISDRAWKALEGAYDLQVHVGPDVIARRIDDIDCAKEFLARGLKGFVLKSHYIQTGERAQVVTKAVPGSRIFGAVTLNHSVGGLNPVAVALADMGALIEHCFTTAYTAKTTWEHTFANIRRTGVQRTVISTDLGQTINPPVAEGFAMFAQKLLDAGFSAADVRTMAVANPARLIGE